MKFSVAFTTALTFGLSFAAPAPFEKRQNANAVATKINAIGTSIAKLNSTLNTLKPNDVLGLFKALTVQQQSSDLEKTIKAATTSVNQVPSQLNDDDSFIVAAAVLDLFPSIQQVLDNIVTKKPAFATAVFFFGDLSKTVRASLVSQRDLTQKLGAAIPPKLSPDLAELAPGIIEQILGFFDTAIAAYDKCSSKKLCLPPIPSLQLPNVKLPSKA